MAADDIDLTIASVPSRGLKVGRTLNCGLLLLSPHDAVESERSSNQHGSGDVNSRRTGSEPLNGVGSVLNSTRRRIPENH